MIGSLWSRLDAGLGRLPMYRVVSLALAVLALTAFAMAAAERLDPIIFDPTAMLLSLIVLLAATVGSGLLAARLVGLRAHPESSLITALLLWFLYWPTEDATGLAFLAAAGVLATASKYVFRWHGRHLFNPAAAGVVVLALIGWVLGEVATAPDRLPYTTWWVGSQVLLPWVVVAGLIVLWRLRRSAHVLVFIVVATAATVLAQRDQGLGWMDALRFSLESTSIVFFAVFMLTEPLTLAPRRAQQVVAAVVAAVVFTLPLTMLAAGYILDLAPVGGSYEIALLAANLVAAVWQRGARMEVVGTRAVGADTVEVRMTPARPLRFTPGQYLELDVSGPNVASDSRGLRRVLSISSPPGAELTVAVRVPERPSAFKRALRGLEVGDRVRGTVVGGDFVWPRGNAPLLLVAGGIGVTPYLSQLRAADRADRDVVLVYGCAGTEVPFAEELAGSGARVVVVSPAVPDDLPDDFEHVAADLLSWDRITDAVPDHAGRRVFVSGPPAMVNALRASVPRARFDHFSGY